MTRPTQSELIERISGFHRMLAEGQFVEKQVMFELLRDLSTHVKDPWIPVEERFPECIVPVGIIRKDHKPVAGYKTINCWWDAFQGAYVNDVTHWCPLPPLLQKGETE